MSKRKISPNILFLIDWVKEAVEFLIICNIPYLLINLYDSAVLKIIKTILVSSHQLRKVEYLLGPKALTAFW